MNKRHVLFTAMVVSGAVSAQGGEGRFDQQGLGGELTLFTGFSSSESNLSTDSRKTIDSLNKSADSETEFMAAPFGQFRYTFGKQQVFAGMSRSDIVEGVMALEFGYAFELADESALSFSYLPTVVNGEVWEDPYLLNSAREKTDVSGNAYRIQYENIGGIGIDTSFAYYDRDVDKELSGGSNDLLKRDGDGYLIEVSTGVPLSQSVFLMPSLSYHKFNADGKAMAFDKYEFGATAMYMLDRHALSLNAGYFKSSYDAENPLFTKTREDNGYQLNFAYEYSDFFGWQDFGFNVLAGYEVQDSNITFYDEKGWMIGMGISYLF
ncbi:DUF2860 domain-containing protein [Vibrio sp. HN007]|uniref:DUF2860 domain-containing protein n=1 Tax=Vibrio iocasae TaxID=3098914 RepID=UPI0035D48D04